MKIQILPFLMKLINITLPIVRYANFISIDTDKIWDLSVSGFMDRITLRDSSTGPVLGMLPNGY